MDNTLNCVPPKPQALGGGAAVTADKLKARSAVLVGTPCSGYTRAILQVRCLERPTVSAAEAGCLLHAVWSLPGRNALPALGGRIRNKRSRNSSMPSISFQKALGRDICKGSMKGSCADSQAHLTTTRSLTTSSAWFRQSTRLLCMKASVGFTRAASASVEDDDEFRLMTSSAFDVA